VAFLVTGGREEALGLMRSAPSAVEHALGAMAETLAAYSRACVEAGADGLFYATNVATRSLMSGEECRRFQRPFDLRVLEAGQGAPVNLLPLCGEGILFRELPSHPPAPFSSAALPGEPTPPAGHPPT